MEPVKPKTLTSKRSSWRSAQSCDIQLGFEPPVPYFFRIGGTPTGDPEQDLWNGHREIVALFAELAGRAGLGPLSTETCLSCRGLNARDG